VPPLGESRAAAWRMANVDDLRNLRYGFFAITRGRHVIYAMTLADSPEGGSPPRTNGSIPRTAVALYNRERANGCNLIIIIIIELFNVALITQLLLGPQ